MVSAGPASVFMQEDEVKSVRFGKLGYHVKIEIYGSLAECAVTKGAEVFAVVGLTGESGEVVDGDVDRFIVKGDEGRDARETLCIALDAMKDRLMGQDNPNIVS